MTTISPPNTPHLFYGTSPGQPALDGDEQGGNPFASSLIEVAADPRARLRSWPSLLRKKTAQRTAGVQVPQALPGSGDPGWRLAEPFGALPESRLALVLVVSRYLAPQAPALYGAHHDERRIAALWASHGFSVTQGVAPSRAALLAALRGFAVRSAGCDTAALYCTGHGVEAGGQTFLLPGDYPFEQGYGMALLRRHALPVERLLASARGRQVNLVFSRVVARRWMPGRPERGWGVGKPLTSRRLFRQWRWFQHGLGLIFVLLRTLFDRGRAKSVLKRAIFRILTAWKTAIAGCTNHATPGHERCAAPSRRALVEAGGQPGAHTRNIIPSQSPRAAEMVAWSGSAIAPAPSTLPPSFNSSCRASSSLSLWRPGTRRSLLAAP